MATVTENFVLTTQVSNLQASPERTIMTAKQPLDEKAGATNNPDPRTRKQISSDIFLEK